ncbi:MAG: hypothetical protein ACO1QB_00425 [Verrucomicrobiales bacterium]
MCHGGTKGWLLTWVGILLFVPFSFAADITKGEFKGAIDGSSAPPKKSSPAPSTPKRKTYPFHGKLASVDGAKNVLIMEGKKGRTIRIDGQTRITRNGAITPLSDGKPGERVTGSITRDDLGQELAVSVKFAAVEESTKSAAGKNKASTSPDRHTRESASH